MISQPVPLIAGLLFKEARTVQAGLLPKYYQPLPDRYHTYRTYLANP
jgi:hypothetical protein